MSKKLLAMLLVLAMALSLIACGNKTTDNKGSDDKTQTSTDTTDKTDDSADAGDTAEDTWSWPLDETGELSMWIVWSSEFADTINDLTVIQEIEKNTNVHVDWTHVASQEAVEKFGLMMASGDYPDILRGAESYYTGGLVQACTDGVVYDLTEYIPQYMPNYMALVNSSEKLQKDTVTDDGRRVGVYTLASNFGEVGGERIWDGMAIRGDWLDELGLEAPVTIDDWHDVLTAFKENYNCEAPLLIGATNGYDVMHNFLNAYGVLGEFYLGEDGTVKYGPLEDGYKQWVELFRQWYAEGLIDPNFVSNDAAFMGSADYMATGRGGASASIWGVTADSYKKSGYTDDENFFLLGVAAPVLNEGDTPQAGMATSEMVKETLSVTTNCENIELALRWLDYWYTEECMLLDSMGIEGETYNVNEDGTYVLSDKVYELVDSGEYPTVANVMSTVTLMTSDFGLYNWGSFDVHNARDLALLEACNIWNVAQFDMLLPTCMTMTEEETIAFNSKYTAIQTLKQEYTVKFISGTISMDEYDSFVQQMYDYGIEECISYKQAALDRYNAR